MAAKRPYWGTTHNKQIFKNTNTGQTLGNLTRAFLWFSLPTTIMQVRCKDVGWCDSVFGAVCFCSFRWRDNPQSSSWYDMRRAFRRHALWLNASKLQMAAKRPSWGTVHNKQILENNMDTNTGQRKLTRAFPCFSPPTMIMMQVR